MPKPYRYYVRAPDGRAIFGFDNIEAARGVAFEYGDGARLVDTLAQAYYPIVQEVRGGDLVYMPHGGWDTGKFGLDRDLIEAVKKGEPATVHAFLAKGASASACDGNGGPVLHWAAAKGKPEIVRLLLDHGADADAADGDGDTALDIARAKGRDEIVVLLQKVGG
ncbi:MAG: ankyrin repeat domain-containing protein [Hyphomicrobiales bacterium]|nr:ankyrin repeat domain-containing protein [Hyphomicrobiales bacterium]